MTVPPAGQTMPALMYHSVSSVGGPLRDLAVPPARLAEQLGALTAAGYRLVGLSAALDLLTRGSAEKLLAVTFDDGYQDFVTAGLPVLAELGAGATLYVSVGHLGDHADWLGPWAPDFGRLMDWSGVVETAAAGIEIGNHSLLHHPLDVLPRAQLRNEIVRSHDRLEQHLQRPVRSFAYPHGYHSRRVRDVVEQTGHDNACEVGRRLHRPGERRFAVPRLQPTPGHTGADLVALARDGGPQLVPGLKRLAQPAWRLTRRAARAAGRNLT
jgi:peptidoglycan/xylan/chitin deacetylase (PgdA/CDA1 family)